VKVRGKGARRLIEIRVRLSKSATMQALVKQGTRSLAQHKFVLRAGGWLVRLPIARRAKAGAATLSLRYNAGAGVAKRATYRLRLPR
jgi:hypothetical protein